MTGLLIKGVGGLYTVYSQGQTYLAKARGKFRQDRVQKPIIGDWVDFEPAQPGDDFGLITAIHARKNSLIRPAVANLDMLLVVLASTQPQPDLLLADKLLLHARILNIPASVVINKSDLAPSLEIARQYQLSGYPVYCVSCQSGQGILTLSQAIRSQIVACAGQSAVGKSSLINALLDDARLPTGQLSKIRRGRHTTRHLELLPLADNTWICDTPGFSLLELPLLDPQMLKTFYEEFDPYEGRCKFLGCSHLREPGCIVRQACEDGVLSKERLLRYQQLYNECKEKWSRRYD